jgi:hypothetical protein
MRIPITVLSLLPTLVACAAPQAGDETSSASRAPAGEHRAVLFDPFPVPAEGLTFSWEGGEGPDLAQVVAEFTRVTGQKLTISDEAGSILRRKKT